MQVFAWGLNTSGQLGLNDVLVRKSPAVVDALWAMPVHQLAAGQTYCLSSSLPYCCILTMTHLLCGYSPAKATPHALLLQA